MDSLHRKSEDIVTLYHETHCKPGQVEPAYIECENSAAAMQVSQGNLFELGPTWLGQVKVSSLDLFALP